MLRRYQIRQSVSKRAPISIQREIENHVDPLFNLIIVFYIFLNHIHSSLSIFIYFLVTIRIHLFLEFLSFSTSSLHLSFTDSKSTSFFMRLIEYNNSLERIMNTSYDLYYYMLYLEVLKSIVKRR